MTSMMWINPWCAIVIHCHTWSKFEWISQWMGWTSTLKRISMGKNMLSKFWKSRLDSCWTHHHLVIFRLKQTETSFKWGISGPCLMTPDGNDDKSCWMMILSLVGGDWNMNGWWLSIQLEWKNHPNWRTHSIVFQRGTLKPPATLIINHH